MIFTKTESTVKNQRRHLYKQWLNENIEQKVARIIISFVLGVGQWKAGEVSQGQDILHFALEQVQEELLAGKSSENFHFSELMLGIHFWMKCTEKNFPGIY